MGGGDLFLAQNHEIKVIISASIVYVPYTH